MLLLKYSKLYNKDSKTISLYKKILSLRQFRRLKLSKSYYYLNFLDFFTNFVQRNKNYHNVSYTYTLYVYAYSLKI